MENTTSNQNKVVLKWGIIYIITSIVITYAFQLLNIDQNSSAKYLGYIPFIAYLLLAQVEYKQQLGGYLKFGQGFSTGFKYALISGIVLGIFTYIYLTYLSPQVFDKAMADSQQKMTDQGNLSSDQIDAAMQIARKYGVIIGTVGVMIGMPIMGALLSTVGAAIFKKDPPPFVIDEDTEQV